MKDVFDEIKRLVKEIQFKNRPIHVSYKYRTIYQISRLVIIVGMASSRWGCSILKAQVLSSALDNEVLFKKIEKSVNNNDSIYYIRNWKYSQLVSTAVNYSNAEAITEYTSTGKIVLTDKGKDFFDEIMADSDILSYEKDQLGKIKKKLSNSKLLSLLERGN